MNTETDTKKRLSVLCLPLIALLAAVLPAIFLVGRTGDREHGANSSQQTDGAVQLAAGHHGNPSEEGDSKRVLAAFASSVDAQSETEEGTLRDLTTDGRWAVVAADPLIAMRTSEEFIRGRLLYHRQEFARSNSVLQYFDGRSWTRLTPSDLDDPQELLCSSKGDAISQHPCPEFTAVEVDGETLWIGTDLGLVRATRTLPPTVEAMYDADSGPAGSWITDIHMAANGDLWVAHRGSFWHTLQLHAGQRYWRHFGGVSRLRGSRWKQFRAQHGSDGSTRIDGTWQTVAGIHPTRITSTEQGAIWVASEVGFSVFEEGNWRLESETTTAPFDEVQILAFAEEMQADPPAEHSDLPAFFPNQV